MSPLTFEQRRRQTTTRLAALMLANAFIFQEQLSKIDGRVMPIGQLLSDKTFVETTCEIWQMIIDDINYVPIFKVARDIILTLPPDSERSVRGLAKKALNIVSNKAALRHDLMGRIYHLLLLEAKYLGTYYTSVPAATLLLKLTLDVDRWPTVDWADPGALDTFRIGDLACGTGTLLMAASQALRDNFIKFRASTGQPIDAASLGDLHKTIIEEVLHGYDVLPSAVHLTASTLALLSPEICFQKMHLYSLPMGKMESGQVCLGSIEYLSGDTIETQLDLISPEDAGVEHVGEQNNTSVARLPPLDVCVMNPPFVRSVGGNLLFGAAGDQRGHMRAELARRLKTTNLSASATAGLGSVFAAVGDRHVRQGGRLALVLPAAALTGVSWTRTRELINHNYVLETLIASHDPKRWNFSENTELSEILLIARKRDRRVDAEPSALQERTQFISLWINPRTSTTALALAEQISCGAPAPIGTPVALRHDISSVMVGGQKYGETIEIPWRELKSSPWIGATFAQTKLVRVAWMLRQGRFYTPDNDDTIGIPMTTMGTIGLIGPDRRDVTDGFIQSPTATPYPALWGHVGDDMRTVAAKANAWLSPVEAALEGRKIRDAALFWRRAGTIMMAERLWMQTQRTMAVHLQSPALSNVWWPFRLRKKNKQAEKALVVWLNSTLGILMSLANRVPTRGSWIQFKKQTMQRMPVLDVLALSADQLDMIAGGYDAIASRDLGTFVELADDKTRAAIDDVICQALGLPTLDGLRRLLAREPIISASPCGDVRDTFEIDDRLEFELL